MKLKDVKIGVSSAKAVTDVKKFLDDFKDLQTENLIVFGFNDDMKYILAENITESSGIHAGYFNVNELFKRLKDVKAKSFILVHNHPNGICIPTITDVETTKKVIEKAKENNVDILEHFTWTNGLLWGIIELSITDGIFIKE